MFLLSIFSFRTLSGWTKFPAGLVCCLLLLGFVELFVARSDWIIRRFPHSSVGVFQALEEQIIEVDGAVPVVICLGNSRLRDGISPQPLEQMLGLPNRSILNLAMTAGTPYDSLSLYRRNRETLSRARVLIVDFEYAYFGTNPDPTARVARYASFADRWRLFRGTDDLFPAVLGGMWRTLGLREYMRALVTEPDQSDDSLIVGEDGRITWRNPENSSEIDLDENFATFAESYAGVRLNSRHANELRRLISLAHDDGLFVILVHVPLRTDFVAYVKEHQAEGYDRLFRAFDDFDFGADIVANWEVGQDVGIPNLDYYDYGHISDSGSRNLTTTVGELMLREFGAEGIRDILSSQ